MSIQATYAGELEFNNTKGLLFSLAFKGNYGAAGVGDLANLAPYEGTGNPGGVLDPNLAYNAILAEPPKNAGVFNVNLGGYDLQLTPNAVPTLTNLGVRIFLAGVELTTAEAYPAPVLAGGATILALIPLQ